MGFLQRRREKRSLFVVSVFLEDSDGEYSDHCVVGPMRRSVADLYCDVLDELISSQWGEMLNAMGFGVSLVVRPVMHPDYSAEWLRARFDLLDLERQARSMLRWAEREEDSDGIVTDTTPWERPMRRDETDND